MKIFRELEKKKEDRTAVARLEVFGNPLVAWKITVNLLIEGKKVASEEKYSLSNEWNISLEHSGFSIVAHRKVNVFKDSEIHFSFD